MTSKGRQQKNRVHAAKEQLRCSFCRQQLHHQMVAAEYARICRVVSVVVNPHGVTFALQLSAHTSWRVVPARQSRLHDHARSETAKHATTTDLLRELGELHVRQRKVIFDALNLRRQCAKSTAALLIQIDDEQRVVLA
jgi:hypothetical protein